jgi:hypothetical protein
MSLPSSTEFIPCQSCGTNWPKTDTTTAYYFESASRAIGSYTSPAEIVSLAEDMTYCPADSERGELAVPSKQPVEGITESPFFRGDSRMKGETEQDVRTRDAELSDTGTEPDVVHEP